MQALDGSELRQKRIKVRTQRGGSADEDDVQNTDAGEQCVRTALARQYRAIQGHGARSWSTI